LHYAAMAEQYEYLEKLIMTKYKFNFYLENQFEKDAYSLI